MDSLIKKIRSEILNERLVFFLLFISFLLRTYRLNELLGFWYDQGRDALVVWDFLYKGKLFLIGPEMGFTGIFRGPWYYWLITPFYALSQGNPLLPAYFLVTISVIAIYIAYKLTKEISGKLPALLVVLVASVSFYLIDSARWLSNPTPMFLISIVFLWSLYRYLDGRWWSLPLASFTLSMGLNFGAAAELFYIPVLFFVVLTNKKKFPGVKIAAASIVIFAVGFLPQILFELRHEGVYVNAIRNFLIADKSFTINFLQVVLGRLSFYYTLIASKFWTNADIVFAPFLFAAVGLVVTNWKAFKKNNKFVILLVLVLVPIVGTFFFRGNKGNIYDYYFTGYYLYFIIFFAVSFAVLFKSNLGRLFLGTFIVLLLIFNAKAYVGKYTLSLDDPEIIAFENQRRALDWVYDDANGEEFNIDVYVPPVIPYAYNYLVQWHESKLCNIKKCARTTQTVPLLYTLSEVDINAPYRLSKWFVRQNSIGKVNESKRFGGITVERRIRN